MNFKQFITLLFFFLAVFNWSNAQQNCDGESFFLTNGATWEYENYRKGKFSYNSITELDTVLFYTDSTVFYVKDIYKFQSADTSVTQTTNGTYVCKDSKIFLSTESISTYDSITSTVIVKQIYLELPSTFNVGDPLPGMTFYFSKVLHGKYYDRKIETLENVETKAGIFECYLISYKVSSVIYGIKIDRIVKEWYSPEIGFVKTEVYNKKGKLKTKKILIKFSK